MKFGVVTHAVGHHMSFEKTLETIKTIGFDSILLLTDRNAEVVSAVGTSKSPFPNVLDSDPEYVQKAIRNAGFELVALHFSGKIDIENDEGVDPRSNSCCFEGLCHLCTFQFLKVTKINVTLMDVIDRK